MQKITALKTDSTPCDRRRIVVVGSLNMDLVMHMPRVPIGGETLTGHQFLMAPGGKGANQALACARMGGKVSMIGRVGDDDFGKTLCGGLLLDGVDVTGLRQTTTVATGVAMILVEDNGQNRIVLSSGANDMFLPDDVDALAAEIQGAAMLVVQLEVPMPAVQRAIEIAHAAGVRVLLNPAPAKCLPEGIWAKVDVLVPNESEAAQLSGRKVSDISSALAAARHFRERGVSCVLLTLGDQGVVVVDDDGERHFPAQVVKAVDTTAAGDTFIGGLVVGLVEGMPMEDAILLGQRASALAVTRYGAQPSIPYRHELGRE